MQTIGQLLWETPPWKELPCHPLGSEGGGGEHGEAKGEGEEHHAPLNGSNAPFAGPLPLHSASSTLPAGIANPPSSPLLASTAGPTLVAGAAPAGFTLTAALAPIAGPTLSTSPVPYAAARAVSPESGSAGSQGEGSALQGAGAQTGQLPQQAAPAAKPRAPAASQKPCAALLHAHQIAVAGLEPPPPPAPSPSPTPPILILTDALAASALPTTATSQPQTVANKRSLAQQPDGIFLHSSSAPGLPHSPQSAGSLGEGLIMEETKENDACICMALSYAFFAITTIFYLLLECLGSSNPP